MKLNLKLSQVGLSFVEEVGLVLDGPPQLARCMSEVRIAFSTPTLRLGSKRKIGNGDRTPPWRNEVTFTWSSWIRRGVAKFVRHARVLSYRRMN
jgi:hypothetical protein